MYTHIDAYDTHMCTPGAHSSPRACICIKVWTCSMDVCVDTQQHTHVHIHKDACTLTGFVYTLVGAHIHMCTHSQLGTGEEGA